jgi:LysR family nitrogen assimilation transcriptional regulator
MTVFCLSGRRLVPTGAGRAVVNSARDALAAIETVGEIARAAGGQVELVIATTPTNGLLLTTALSDLGRCEPNLDITVRRASDGDDVLRKVHSGEAEIGFAELTSVQDDRQLISKPITEMEVVLVSPIGSDLPAAVSWDDVVTQPLIMPPAGSGRRQLIDGMAATAGTAAQVSIVIEDRGAWIAAAQAGMGSFLSYRCVVASLERIEIRSFKPPHTSMVGFIHRVGPISRAAAQLIDLSRASYGSSIPVPAE